MFIRIFCVAGMIFLTGCTDTPPSGPGGSFHPTEITVTEARGPSDLKVLQDDRLEFTDSAGVVWVAPKGTLTDGATVPRLALPLSDGRYGKRYLKAAVIHDAYCQSFNRDLEQYQSRPWREVHRMFYEGCLAGGTPPLEAGAMYAAVLAAGPRWLNPSEAGVDPAHAIVSESAVDADLARVSDEKLNELFDRCKAWIEKANPAPDEIEAWINKHRAEMLDE